jgi:hypothetical protein
MLIPDLETPEALFGWLAARGALSGTQARAALAAVRSEMAGDGREARPVPGETAGDAPEVGAAATPPLTDEEAMAVALADLERLDAGRERRP